MELTVDGDAVFATTGGQAFDPSQPTVVFIHGAGMDHTVWQLQTRYFAWHGRSVLAVDMPAHGRSGGAPLASVEDMADWIGRLLDAVGAERAALVGHSVGGMAALEAAARMPERVSALALLGVAATMPVHPGLLSAADANDHLAYELVTAWGFGRPAHLGGHRAPGYWMLGGGMRLLERDAPGVLGSDLAASDAYRGGLAAAAKVACPTLLLLGDGDRMSPAKGARALADEIADARTVILPRCGHMMMVERPDDTLDALREVV